MVNRCVNPACHTEFRLLNNGDLYTIERPGEASEFFWICSHCASTLHPSLDPARKISLRPSEDSDKQHPAQSRATLRLVAHTPRRMPWRHDVPAGFGPVTELLGVWSVPNHGARL